MEIPETHQSVTGRFCSSKMVKWNNEQRDLLGHQFVVMSLAENRDHMLQLMQCPRLHILTRYVAYFYCCCSYCSTTLKLIQEYWGPITSEIRCNMFNDKRLRENVNYLFRIKSILKYFNCKKFLILIYNGNGTHICMWIFSFVYCI